MSADDPRQVPSAAADAERDAWLREALRHAPDAAAAPPAALRETILAQARAATAGSASPRRGAPRGAPGGSFAAFWAWLPRPPVAGGFAGLMAATLVGVMWWDRPMDLALPRPAAPAAERSAPAAAPSAPPALLEAPAPAPAAPTVAPPPPGQTQEVPARAARSRAVEQEAGSGSRRAARNEAPEAFPSAESKASAGASPAEEDRGARPAAAEATSELRSPVPRPSSVAAPPTVPPAARQRMAASGETRRGTTGPLSTLFASLAAEPSRWARRGGGGAVAPLDATTRRWLDDVDAATRGRWTDAAATAGMPPETGAPTGEAPVREASLVLMFDGRPAAVVGLGASSAVLDASIDGTTRRWHAALPAADAARLASTLPR